MVRLPAVVRPLEATWQPLLDAVLRGRGAPPTSAAARLGPALAALSQAYNAAGAERPRVPLEARVAFSFARDVPKGAGAVRELVRTGVLRVREDAPLRVLDLGAGLGAMSWGIARALAAAGQRGRVEALLVDDDEDALAAAEAIAKEAAERLGPQPVELAIRTRRGRIEDEAPAAGAPGRGALDRADVVVVGQVLSELDRAGAPGADPAARAARHAELLRRLLAGRVAPDGALVVIEPALRDRTRHLHAVRDRLAAAAPAGEEPVATVFAPCLHAGACPALAVPGEWCHEDLDVDLPEWLVPLARAAGLRWQGLTFSHLVLRRDGVTLAGATGRADAGSAASGKLHLRVISGRIETKGKIELLACTASGARARLRRLDRERTDASAPWDALVRGDVVTLSAPDGEAPVDPRGRLSPKVVVDVWRGKN
jgi:SAM-dependent methyltransferase